MKCFHKACSLVMAVIIVLCMLSGSILTTSAVTSDHAITVEGGNINAGEEVSVAVTLSGSDDVYGITFALDYPADFTVSGYTVRTDDENATVNTSYDTGKVFFGTFDSDVLSAGTLVTFKFIASSSAAGSYTFSIDGEDYMLSDRTGNKIAPVALQSGIVNVACSEHSYGAWTVVTEATPETEGLKTRTCSVCGYVDSQSIDKIKSLSIYTLNLTLRDNLAVKYWVNSSLFTETGYTDPYIIFNMNGQTTTVDTYTTTVSGGVTYYLFDFSNIRPDRMNDNIEAVLYADYNGTEYHSTTVNYSIKQYCYTMLNRYESNVQYAKLNTLIVDLLNYGSCSQIYTGYKTDTLVNADLTESQKALGTAEDRAYVNLAALTDRIDNPDATWYNGSLSLSDTVMMRVHFNIDDITGVTLQVRDKNKNLIQTIPASEFITESSSVAKYYKYSAKFNKYGAGQMSDAAYFTLYRDGVQISDTFVYSVETYAYQAADYYSQSDPALSNLIKATIRYGDSAAAYK